VLLLSEPQKYGELAMLLANSDLPLRIILLDGFDNLAGAKNPALLALAQQNAFVASAAVSHSNHLYQSVAKALASPGPALIHVHTPSPLRHDFATDATITQARAAVETRQHPLFTYDPEVAGAFGTRLSLEGNPDADKPRAAGPDGKSLNPALWALGEGRFQNQLAPVAEGDDPGKCLDLGQWLDLEPAQRQGKTPVVSNAQGRQFVVASALARAIELRERNWTVLQEISGVLCPFTTKIKARLEADLKSAHLAEIEDLKKLHADRLVQFQQQQQQLQAAQLRERLLKLSGLAQVQAAKPVRNGSDT